MLAGPGGFSSIEAKYLDKEMAQHLAFEDHNCSTVPWCSRPAWRRAGLLANRRHIAAVAQVLKCSAIWFYTNGAFSIELHRIVVLALDLVL